MKSIQPAFDQLNNELTEFYKYLKANNYTDEEVRKIFAPLRPNTPKITAAVLLTSLLLATLYLATHVETVSWHFSALGRIFLIKLLPLWDWTNLKNAKCLIEKPSSSTIDQEITFNCQLCESINAIDVYDDISGDFLKKRYLDVEVPVILKKNWEKPPTVEDFIGNLVKNQEISASRPCSLSTNIHGGVPTVRKLLQKTPLFDRFFLHFQNCDLGAMKQFRGFTPRPKFLPPELFPVQYNWLLWSKDYNVTQFKSIGLVEKVAVVGQIFGGNFIKLVPRANCELECPVIDVRLNEGESLIFTSLWNLEYRPDFGDNLAVILEMH